MTPAVYDIVGRQVSVLMNERRDPGTYEVRFDASGLSSGVYFYRLRAGEFTQTKRLVLLSHIPRDGKESHIVNGVVFMF